MTWFSLCVPTGINIVPPIANCSINFDGIMGVDAPTWIKSNGACEGKPSKPSPSKKKS